MTAKPTETNSTIEALHVHCLEGPAIDLYSHDLGPVLPLEGGAEADYFYKPGMISADVDGQKFPLVAAGSDEAVVLFSEGEEAKGYLAPVDRALFEAMVSGKLLTLSLDILRHPRRRRLGAGDVRAVRSDRCRRADRRRRQGLRLSPPSAAGPLPRSHCILRYSTRAVARRP